MFQVSDFALGWVGLGWGGVVWGGRVSLMGAGGFVEEFMLNYATIHFTTTHAAITPPPLANGIIPP